jgi:uncharacterized Zn-binding protein involved in type VI secretion
MGPPVPAVVMNDRITGICATHQVPSPVGAPMPSPAPMPFGAPLTTGLATKVMAQGKPMAVVGSSGVNTPPHVGLHATDPFMTPTLQKGQISNGSSKVFIENKPAAYTGCQTMVCFGMPGMVTGTASKVGVSP